MEKKVFSVKLKIFSYLAFAIIAFGVVYSVNALINYEGDYRSAVSGGLFTIVIGLFFYFYGQRTRKIIVDKNGIEYHNAKARFDISWENLILIKSFQEQGKSSENLILIDNNEHVLSISTAFFDDYVLKDAFRYIVEKSKNFENITIEDDRKWLENSI